MEPLINIIVTIVIIIFVLRRMADVARKGGDITGPPPPPTMFPEESEKRKAREMRRRELTVEEERPRRYTVPGEETFSEEARRGRTQRMQERLRDAQRRFEAQRRAVEEQKRVSEEDFESARSTVRSEEYREPRVAAKRLVVKPPKSGMRSRRGAPLPIFQPRSLAQGIIWREILGPPVSLRGEEHG